MKNLLLIILFIVVLVLSALFFAQNDALVEIQYFSGAMELQMNWVLVSVFVLGFLLGIGLLITSLVTTKLKLANTKRQLLNREKEIQNLRALPIKNDY
ncbi:MAG: lipopolysaccharide assembly protein LapA domain-containing protein [Kangiellaceae bacterium]